MKKLWWSMFAVSLVVAFVAGVSFISDLRGTNYLNAGGHFNWVEACWTAVGIAGIIFSSLRLRRKA